MTSYLFVVLFKSNLDELHTAVFGKYFVGIVFKFYPCLSIDS